MTVKVDEALSMRASPLFSTCLENRDARIPEAFSIESQPLDQISING